MTDTATPAPVRKRRPRWATPLIAIPLALLAACSGGGGAASDVDYTSAKAIAAAIDKGGYACTGWTPNTEVMGAREDGTCDHSGTMVSVTTFNSAEQMQEINKAIATLASGVYVAGDKWQVNVPDKDQATAVQKIVGGEVK